MFFYEMMPILLQELKTTNITNRLVEFDFLKKDGNFCTRYIKYYTLYMKNMD